jgi:hypothetical protein
MHQGAKEGNAQTPSSNSLVVWMGLDSQARANEAYKDLRFILFLACSCFVADWCLKVRAEERVGTLLHNSIVEIVLAQGSRCTRQAVVTLSQSFIGKEVAGGVLPLR